MEAVCVFVNDHLDHSCLGQLAKYGVKLIALRCAGFNNMDLEAAKEFGFVIVRVPAYSPHAIAEHAISLLLTLNRRIHRAHNRVREHNFSLNGLIGFNLAGKTIGIIGTGKIGRIAARIYRGFDCRVIANDIIPDPDWGTQYDVEYTTLTQLLQHSDIISLHLPVTAETCHFICHETIMQMKKNIYLINTSRGKLIDTTALLAALKEGHFWWRCA